MIRHGYCQCRGKFISGENWKGEVLWSDTGTSMIGRSDIGVHDSIEAAGTAAIKYRKVLKKDHIERSEWEDRRIAEIRQQLSHAGAQSSTENAQTRI